jgi:hypothetical protein
MKKNLIVIIITLFCIQLLFMGCNEPANEEAGKQDNTIKEEIIELINYSIETYDAGLPWESDDETLLGYGFNHNERADYYLIIGTIKNKLNINVSLEVIMNFYDADEQYLDSYSFELNSILSKSYRSFTIHINENNFEEFFNFESVVFEFEQIG